MTLRPLIWRHALFASVALSPVTYAGSNPSAAMAERYGDVQKCIEHVLGKHWQQRFQIELTTNRWGVIEATHESIDSAPQAVRITDLRCRRELSLAGQPRP